MSRAVLPLLLGAGLLALAMTARGGTRQFQRAELTPEELALYLDPDGLLYTDPASKPAVNSTWGDGEVDTVWGDPWGSPPFVPWGSPLILNGVPAGLHAAPDFDWGAWGDTLEWWTDDAGSTGPDYGPVYGPGTGSEGGDVIEIQPHELLSMIAEHLIQTEGFRPYVYDDFNGKPWSQSKIQNPTIGYGHMLTKDDKTNPARGFGWTMTQEEAYALLLEDIDKHFTPLVSKVKVPLTLNQWIIIASMGFGSGPGTIAKSKWLRAINSGAPLEEIEREFKDWNKSTVYENGVPRKFVNKGLVNRRNKEWAMWVQPAETYAIAGQNYA